ncbi:MAG: hypothetical protein ACOC34_01830 [Thermotogota bacterium]
MVSAAAQTAVIPIRRSDYDKRVQDNILSLLLRRIKEIKESSSSSLLLKYQHLRELLTENKTTEVSQYLDKFYRELTSLNQVRIKEIPSNKYAVKNKKNSYVNSTHFEKLFPKADVLFEISEYGIAAREVLREAIDGQKKGEIEFLPNSNLFKNQWYFNGYYMESYSNNAFEGFKGLQFDFHL